MVWEGNARGGDSQYHCRVYFAMSVGFAIVLFIKLFYIHAYHRCLLFLYVQELYKSLVQKILKSNLLIYQLLYMRFCDLKGVVFDHEQGSHYPTLISQDSNFSILYVSY